MERSINIGGKEIKLKSSLFTIISYKNTFGTDLFDDVSKLDVSKNKGASNMTRIIQILFQIIYSLHKPFTNETFDEFLSNFDFSVISDSSNLESISPIIGELLTNQNKRPEEKSNP